MKAAQELIHSIGQRIGLPDLQLDENRQVTFTLDDVITVTFLAEDSGELTAVNYVADYLSDAKKQEQVGRHLLQLNFLPSALGGGKLCINPKDDGIVLLRTWNCSMTDAETLYTEFEIYVNAVSALKQEIEHLSGDPIGESAQESPMTSTLMMHGQMA
jgi:hypothetical protein